MASFDSLAYLEASSRLVEGRSDSTDGIACWIIDTAYDDAQFFVRHACFLGAGDRYDKLRRALRPRGWQVDRYDRALSS